MSMGARARASLLPGSRLAVDGACQRRGPELSEVVTVTEPARRTVAAGVGALAASAAMAQLWRLRRGAVAYLPPGPAPVSAEADLAGLRRERVFFGHQSVGANILDGVRQLYGDSEPPDMTSITTVGDLHGAGAGFIADARIGENGAPATKIAAFDALLRAGVGDRVDVALMKLCYVDFGPRADPREVFTRYSRTMAALERDYPAVSFVYTTAPLVSGEGPRSRYSNSVRTQFNSLVRAQPPGARLLDLAALEASGPDGRIEPGTVCGFTYESMRPEYTSDGGHLNPDGARRLARAFVARVVNHRAPDARHPRHA